MSQDYVKQDEIIGKNKDYRSFIYLLRYSKKSVPKFCFALCLITGSAVAAILSARMMGNLVEKGLIPQNTSESWDYAMLIIALEITAILSIWGGRRLMSIGAAEFILNIRSALFKHIHFLPMSYFDRQPQGRTVTRITYDVEGVEQFFTSSLGRLVNSLIVFMMAIIAMMLTNWKLGLILTAAMIPAVLLTFFYTKTYS